MKTTQILVKHINLLPLALLLVCFSVIVGCEKPNPHPETLDPIFGDLESKLKLAENDLKGAEKQLEDFKDALAKVVPQTGQVKFARKRVYDSEAVVEKLKQKVEFIKIRIESRRKYAKESYMRSYQKKEPWPRPEEYQEYRAQQALEGASRSWNAKSRLEASKPEAKQAGSGHGDAAEAPPEHH
jgi:hypothetical protein